MKPNSDPFIMKCMSRVTARGNKRALVTLPDSRAVKAPALIGLKIKQELTL